MPPFLSVLASREMVALRSPEAAWRVHVLRSFSKLVFDSPIAEGTDNQGDNPLPPETILCLREGSQEVLLSKNWCVGRKFLVKQSKIAPVYCDLTSAQLRSASFSTSTP